MVGWPKLNMLVAHCLGACRTVTCNLPRQARRNVPQFPHLSSPRICKDFGEKRESIGNLLFTYLFVNREVGFFNQILTSDLFAENG